MTKSIPVILALLLSGALSGVAMAHDQDKDPRHEFRDSTPEQRAEMMAERMAEKLGLSETQREQVEDVNLRYSQEISALQDLDREERRARMHDIHARRHEEVSTLLNDEQLAQLEAFKARLHERGPRPFRHGGRHHDKQTESEAESDSDA